MKQSLATVHLHHRRRDWYEVGEKIFLSSLHSHEKVVGDEEKNSSGAQSLCMHAQLSVFLG